MSFQRFLPTVLLSFLHLGCAMATDDIAEPVGVADSAIGARSDMRLYPLSNNGLVPGLLTNDDNLVAMNTLAKGSFAGPTALVESESGRTLLSYIARCALPSGYVASVTAASGQAYGFQGLLGLAPEWRNGAIAQEKGRWVSACLLAHANLYGKHVNIELVGAHPALASRPANLTAQEAAFYGDLFAGRHQVTTMFACIGSARDGLSEAPPRVCGRTESCGFTITGFCGEPSDTPVCSGGPDAYTSCEAQPASGASYQAEEIITVYTDPSVLVTEPSCSHEATEVGFPLPAACSEVVAAVCDADAFCCETRWDDACVAEAGNLSAR